MRAARTITRVPVPDLHCLCADSGDYRADRQASRPSAHRRGPAADGAAVEWSFQDRSEPVREYRAELCCAGVRCSRRPHRRPAARREPSALAGGISQDQGWTAAGVAALRDVAEMADVAGPNKRELAAELGDVAHDLPAFLTVPLYRRWHLRWGATSAETVAGLPGDTLVPHAQYKSTRAITIGAPPDAVWPWLVQVGCQRAGFYSNDLLDNLGRPSATTIMPSLQRLRVGQWVPMSPAATPTDRTVFKVHSFEVNEWLLWAKPDSTWLWRLTPAGSNGTRLVTRIHAVYDWRHPPTALLDVLLMEFGDFAMLRRMLRGIKARAESLVQNTSRPAA
jgi:hypothetical protein